jgi:hypothetical protein
MFWCREAPVGIEPTNGGFADLCLTTWLRRRRTGNLFPRVALLKPPESCGYWTLAESPIWATIRAILRDRFGISRPRSYRLREEA